MEILGDRVLRARSSEEAISLLRTQDCGLAMVDLRKPGLGGIETGRRIRQAGMEALPLLFLVSFDPDPDDLASIAALAPSDYLTRPLDDAALQLKVRTFAALQRDTTDRLAAIVDSSDDAIISKTLDGVILTWNDAARRIFGYEEDEAVGQPITMIIPDDRLQEENLILDKIGRGEKVAHYETVRRRKDGSLVDVSLTVSPIRDATGRVVGASKVARDVTAEKHFREELQRLNLQLEERVRERTSSLEEMVRELNAFTYTVAHDLRAPLRAIHSFGQLLLEDYGGRLEDEGRGWLDQIIDGSDRMDALIRDLLDYTRISRAQIRLAAVDLDAVVQDSLVLMKEDLVERRAKVRVDLPLGRVVGNPLALGQAVSNLVSNAAKFVPPGRMPSIVIRAERRGARRRLWIEDNGLGIDPEHRARIFKLFERLHPREQFPGTGIGLAIVSRAAERMGGEVGVESVPGEGSRFYIELLDPDPPAG